MEGRAQVFLHACGVYWTSLLLIVCVTLDSGSAYVADDGTRLSDASDSIRLLRLKLLSLELGSNMRPERVYPDPQTVDNSLNSGPSWGLIEALRSNAGTSQYSTTQKRDDLDLVMADSRNVDVIQQQTMDALNRLLRQSSAMQNFQGLYNTFHDSLTDFVNLLATRFIPGAPDELQNVKDIPLILPKDDPAFASGNVEQLVPRADFVLDVTNAVLAKIAPVVMPEYQAWLATEQNQFSFMTGMLRMSLLSFQTEGSEPSGLQVLPDGISGINIGVENGIDRQVLDNLNAMYQALGNYLAQLP